MKTRFLMVLSIGMFTFFGILDIQNVDALCMRNQDWSGAPCYGCIGCTPSLEKQKLDWAPYYDYKGAEFMEQKKQEMLNAIKNNQLDQWIQESHQNSNVYRYYESHGITNEMMVYGLSQDVGLILVVAAMTSGIIIFILRKR